ncbi:MAG: SRPBCC family protein [Geminicoccaceae bacterium]|jgi:hypothetical protein|nr:SRPBCC family protein [Geminicoccaceae bacterium]MCB9966790.1 SRPBCC family protein [Geminicoccaceae bacterium]HRY23876.1 SRPBCC family protein [Geminicoccaceae bacterium]
MQVRTHPLILALPVLLAASPAPAIEVQRHIDVSAPAEEVWSLVGDFCSIEQWHPEVTGCELEEDDATTFRTLRTADGSTIREQLLDHDAAIRFYSYSLVESPWPVTGLVSEFQLAPGAVGENVIVWQAQYSTLAVDKDAAEKSLGAFYRNGLEGIAGMFTDE